MKNARNFLSYVAAFCLTFMPVLTANEALASSPGLPVIELLSISKLKVPNNPLKCPSVKVDVVGAGNDNSGTSLVPGLPVGPTGPGGGCKNTTAQDQNTLIATFNCQKEPSTIFGESCNISYNLAAKGLYGFLPTGYRNTLDDYKAFVVSMVEICFGWPGAGAFAYTINAAYPELKTVTIIYNSAYPEIGTITHTCSR